MNNPGWAIVMVLVSLDMIEATTSDGKVSCLSKKIRHYGAGRGVLRRRGRGIRRGMDASPPGQQRVAEGIL